MIIGSQSSQCNEFSFYGAGGCWLRSSRSGAFGGGGGRCCKSEAAAQRDSIITPRFNPTIISSLAAGGGRYGRAVSVQQLDVGGLALQRLLRFQMFAF